MVSFFKVLERVKDDEDEESGISEEEEDDDGGGWICPGNLAEARREMLQGTVEEKTPTVACLTTDFAMQV